MPPFLIPLLSFANSKLGIAAIGGLLLVGMFGVESLRIAERDNEIKARDVTIGQRDVTIAARKLDIMKLNDEITGPDGYQRQIQRQRGVIDEQNAQIEGLKTLADKRLADYQTAEKQHVSATQLAKDLGNQITSLLPTADASADAKRSIDTLMRGIQ